MLDAFSLPSSLLAVGGAVFRVARGDLSSVGFWFLLSNNAVESPAVVAGGGGAVVCPERAFLLANVTVVGRTFLGLATPSRGTVKATGRLAPAASGRLSYSSFTAAPSTCSTMYVAVEMSDMGDDGRSETESSKTSLSLKENRKLHISKNNNKCILQFAYRHKLYAMQMR